MGWWLLGIVFYGMIASIIYCLIIEAIGEGPRAAPERDEAISGDGVTR